MYSLLIVDDEPEILEGIREMLLASSLPLKEVRTAQSARQALTMFAQSPFDIIISDIRMPEMDGLEMVRETRRIWPRTSVIFLTGFRDFEYAHQAIQLGSADYLVKPVFDEHLLESLQRVIDKLDAQWEQMLDHHALQRQAEEHQAEQQRLFLLRLLEGENIGGESALDQPLLDRLSLPFCCAPGASVLVGAVRVDSVGEEGLPPVHFLIQNVLEELLAGYHILCLPYDGPLMALLIQPNRPSNDLSSQRDGLDSALQKQLEELQSFFDSHLQLVLSIGVMEPLGWGQLAQGFQRLVKLQQGLATQGQLCFWSLAEREPLSGSERKESNYVYVVNSVRAYIQGHLGEGLSLSELSQRFRINPSYLSRVFHRATGEQLSSYITAARIEAAKGMLRRSNLKAYEIAAMVGFETANYFAKVFRRVTGMTPTEFRSGRAGEGKEK